MSYYIGLLGNILKNEKYTIQCISLSLEKALSIKSEYEDQDFDDSIYLVIHDEDAPFENLVMSTLLHTEHFPFMNIKEIKIIGLRQKSNKLTNSIVNRNLFRMYERRSYETDLIDMFTKNTDVIFYIGTVMNNSKLKKVEEVPIIQIK